MTPTLSIVVPTCNARRTIAATLESILQQIESLEGPSKGTVALHLGDDGSSDGTRELVREFAKAHPDLVTSSWNEKNLGHDRNISQLITNNARGRYVWVCSDDDRLMPGAIARVLEAIERHPDIEVLYNDWIGERDFATGSRTDGLRQLDVEGYLPDTSDFFYAIRDRGLLISSFIYTVEAFRRAPCLRHVGSNWHWFAAMAHGVYGRPGYVVPGKQVIMGEGRNRWARGGRALYLAVSALEIHLELRALGYSPRYIDHFMRASHQHSALSIFVAKANGFPYDLRLIRRMARIHGRYWDFWPFRLPLFFIPNTLCAAAMSLALRSKRWAHERDIDLELEESANLRS
jgi:glycosyltransferase involved in cell wall biosynthesis